MENHEKLSLLYKMYSHVAVTVVFVVVVVVGFS